MKNLTDKNPNIGVGIIIIVLTSIAGVVLVLDSHFFIKDTDISNVIKIIGIVFLLLSLYILIKTVFLIKKTIKEDINKGNER